MPRRTAPRAPRLSLLAAALFAGLAGCRGTSRVGGMRAAEPPEIRGAQFGPGAMMRAFREANPLLLSIEVRGVGMLSAPPILETRIACGGDFDEYQITLIAPDGTSAVVERRGAPQLRADRIVRYGDAGDAPAAEMARFTGKAADGLWQLEVRDLDPGDADDGGLSFARLSFPSQL